MKRYFISIICFSLLLGCKTLELSKKNILTFKIIEYGIFENSTKVTHVQDKTTAGYIWMASNLKLLKQTTEIPAKIGNKFGVLYIIEDKNNQKLDIEVITKVKHPMFRNNSIEEWKEKKTVNTPTYDGFKFDYDYELFEGEWIIEIWYDNLKYLEKSFYIKHSDNNGIGTKNL